MFIALKQDGESNELYIAERLWKKGVDFINWFLDTSSAGLLPLNFNMKHKYLTF